MIIVRFIDYLYYQVNWWNRQVMKENGFNVFSNSISISALLVMNIISLIIMLSSYFQLKIEILDNEITSSILLVLLLALVYIYFKYHDRHQDLIARYNSYSTQEKKMRNRVILTYILGTVLLFIGTIMLAPSPY